LSMDDLQQPQPRLAVPKGVVDADIAAGAYVHLKYRGQPHVGAMVLRVHKAASIDSSTGFTTTVMIMTDYGTREQLLMPEFLKKVVSVVGYEGGVDPSGNPSVKVPDRPILELDSVSAGLAKLGDLIESEQTELTRMLAKVEDKLNLVSQRDAYESASGDYASLRVALFEALERRLPDAKSEDAPPEAVELLRKLHRAMTSEAPPKPAGIVPGDEAGAKRGKAGESPRSAKKAKKAEQQTPVEKARAQYHQAVADAAAEGKEPWMLLDGLSGHKASTAGAKGVHFKEELHRVLKEPKDFYAEWTAAGAAKSGKQVKKSAATAAALAALRARGHGFVNFLSEANKGLHKVEAMLKEGYMVWHEQSGKLEKVDD